MQCNVRRAVIGDEPVLRALRLQALTDSPGAFSSTYERELARTIEDWRRWLAPGVTFILDAGGEPRGLVAGSREPHDVSVVHLVAMWVHPDLRGTGAADVLVSSVKAWAGQVGATQVHLKVVESNCRASCPAQIESQWRWNKAIWIGHISNRHTVFLHICIDFGSLLRKNARARIEGRASPSARVLRPRNAL